MSNISKEGEIIAIDEIIEFDSGFTKREFVIKSTDDGEYPQDIKFELVKDKTALVDKYKLGDKVTVHFNVRGREYNGKYYVNLVAWKLDGQGLAANPVQQQSAAATTTPQDDIPF
jgi:hypothetical protein